MTGGQYSGTTPENSFTATSRYSHIEDGFDLCRLVESAGAPYVARSTVYNIMELQNMITEAISKKGFSFVEAISPCTTHYGRLNGMKTSAAMLKWIKENSLSIKQAEKLSLEEKKDKFITGKFVDLEKPDYSSKYEKVIEKAMAAKGGF
jgi:2-oxoglutarate ferredoxin oxidoreductase subunit beta